MRTMITAAFAVLAIAAAAPAGAQYGAYVGPHGAYVGAAPSYGYGAYAQGPGYAYGSNQTYYNSYRADHAYGYNTFQNRPMDSASMNKRHLEGWE